MHYSRYVPQMHDWFVRRFLERLRRVQGIGRLKTELADSNTLHDASQIGHVTTCEEQHEQRDEQIRNVGSHRELSDFGTGSWHSGRTRLRVGLRICHGL